MALAYSDLTIARGTISANPATIQADLHLLLTEAGWASSPYGTGKLYAVVSPQGLAAQVRIWDEVDANFASCLTFQWVTSSSPLSAGLKHHLRMDAAYTYYVWANCCSLFMARPGVTHSGAHPWSVCGGIPWADGLTTPTAQCAAQSPAGPNVTNELWWSSGADSGVALFAAATLESFRSGHYCKRYSFCRNGVVSSVELDAESTALALAIMRPAGYDSRRHLGFASGMKFLDGTPMASDPVLIRGAEFTGQLYDACLLSAPMALEAVEEITETTPTPDRITSWVNHTFGNTNDIFVIDDGRLYSLLLFTGMGGGDANVAY